MADGKDEFDLVIIGAGSAGCVLANRLSENENISVLLLEAGPEDTKPDIHIPIKADTLLGTEVDWQYQTVPQKNGCFAMKDNRCTWSKGKVLGGSSSINGMQYVRGCKEDYDSWARLGAEGWSYDEVLPYFLKSENNTSEEYLKTDYHASGGPLTVSDVFPRCEYGKVVIEGARELGFKINDANNCIDPVGFNYIQATIKDGNRCSTAVGFLNPVKTRTNLTIWTETLATKILFQEKKATYVEFLKDGQTGCVRVNKELILSAGSVASPQLLMLSGVGPRAHLEELGIPLVCDLPVGDNMQDHILTIMKCQATVTGGGISEDWLSSNVIELTGFLKTEENIPWPDIQIYYSPCYYFGPDEKEVCNFRDEFDKTLEYTSCDLASKEGVSFQPGLLHPKSLGTVRLKSQNPLDQPLLDPCYLEDPDDVKTMIRGIRVIQKLASTKAFTDYGFIPSYFKFDNCPHEFDSDKYWEHVIRHLTLTIWHVCGTCKMGAKDDPSAVMDPTLRVRGLDNVRVVDASVMPHLTSGNINAPVIMIAEKGADMIKRDL